MSTITISRPKEDAWLLAKAAFEQTEGIETYYDSGGHITGNTGIRVFSSYGESVKVEPVDTPDANETILSISADKNIPLNITANPERYKSRYLAEISSLNAQQFERVVSKLDDDLTEDSTKEVVLRRDQAGEIFFSSITLVSVFLFVVVMLGVTGV